MICSSDEFHKQSGSESGSEIKAKAGSEPESEKNDFGSTTLKYRIIIHVTFCEIKTYRNDIFFLNLVVICMLGLRAGFNGCNNMAGDQLFPSHTTVQLQHVKQLVTDEASPIKHTFKT
jgi:hypothetical protein